LTYVIDWGGNGSYRAQDANTVGTGQSVAHKGDKAEFGTTDMTARLAVVYLGALPDLFHVNPPRLCTNLAIGRRPTLSNDH